MEQRLSAIRLPHSSIYRSTVKESKKSNALSDYRLHVLLFMAVIIVTIFSNIILTNYIKKMDKEIHLIQNESIKLKKVYKVLLEKENKLKNRDRLEKIGKDKGLHPPTKSQILYIKGGR